jgi:hypothetical protein
MKTFQAQRVFYNMYLFCLLIFFQRLIRPSYINFNPVYLWWNGEKWIPLQWNGKEFVPLWWNRQKTEEIGKKYRLKKALLKENCNLDETRIEIEEQLKQHDNKDGIAKIGVEEYSKEIIMKNLNQKGKIARKAVGEIERGTPEDSSPSKTYKSPMRKLLPFFEKSRDQWKAKCIQTKKQLKLFKMTNKRLKRAQGQLKNRINQLELELSQLKEEAQFLKKELEEFKRNPRSELQNTGEYFDRIPARHHYSIGVIYLYVSLVLSASSSLRGAARALEIFRSVLNWPYSTPSWTSGRLWLLRLGYYKLMRPKEPAEDWVWLIDHVVQVGAEKCLAIYGIRLQALSQRDRVLGFEDLEPLAIWPVTHSTGEIILHQLEETAKKTGLPREILGDQGSDIKSGIDQFCQKYPRTCYIHDTKHKVALLLKYEFDNDTNWQEFTRWCSLTKQKLQQTALGFLIPPQQRAKARYMNIETTIQWGMKALAFLEEQEKNPNPQLDQESIHEKLGGVRIFSENLKEWSELCQWGAVAVNFVRKEGFYAKSEVSLKKEFLSISESTKRVKRFQKELLDFVKLESLKAGIQEKLLGSSEIIESIFGKLKEVEKDQSKSGFTGLVLIMAAMVSTTTIEVIQKALETVPTQKVIDWCKKHIGQSVQAKRKEFLKSGEAEQKRNQLIVQT